MADVLIIGAGPAGLTAALYAARAGRKVTVLEQLGPGGQAATTWRVDNYPGVPQVNGADLMARLHDQVRGFGVHFVSGQALGLEPGELHTVRTTEGFLSAHAVIIATGATPRRLGIPGELELRGRGVSYCATCDGAFFKGQPLAVIGGGNTALEEAEFLLRFASKIYLVHRRTEFRADRCVQGILQHPQVEVVTPYTPREIHGSETVSGLLVEERGGQACRELDVKGVFIFVGLTPQTEAFREVLTLDPAGYIVTTTDFATSVPGVFAAGDCRVNYSKQIVVAAGEGAVAAVVAERYLEKKHVK
ncbi:MAG: FAD-dependent oxidoreductase [Candidatus Firestonebacteria bacterium]|nr:FAD-dependent oxidoreductase [Candidatus Firestonebacteria bacterium]